ncbi:hypothetical protein I3842_09G121600 [Carya illinoinensis]|uniref:Uncharacterized protein n=1 Tax=Carya illinoinensis TaxID=32201 RepID=A0A922E395_CARIL|nr:hypothetical protein I3842_09G121600 [Carya illinoinensis]
MANPFRNFSIKDKYGAMAATATVPAIVIFAGVYVAWVYASRVLKKYNPPVLSKSTSIGMLHGGKLALKRLLDYHHARADANVLDEAANELKTALGDAYPDFWNLKCNVAKMEMNGKEDEAVTMLETAFEEAKKQRKPHEAYEIEMLLVEMLIYKGEFKKANDCECLSSEDQISDARRPLYKAVLQILLGHSEDQAFNCWKDFKRLRKHFLLQPSLEEEKIHKIFSDFDEFKKLINLLKEDIKKDRLRKAPGLKK